MTSKWPAFVTKDLSDAEDSERQRRWNSYNRSMQEIIASGTAHQDNDGWWVDTATGEIIGPDPEIERPWTDDELSNARPMREAAPGVHAALTNAIRKRGPAKTKEAVSIRLDIDLVAGLRATGPGWQSRVNAALREYLDRVKQPTEG